MPCRLWIYVALCSLLGAAGCSNLRPEAAATPPAVPAPAAPTALAPPPAAPAAPSAVPEARFAAVAPAEIQVVMVELSLAHALDVCGFPALGQFMLDYTQQKIESCPNSAARKAALREVVAGTVLHEKRLDEQARAQGTASRCEQEDKLKVIKEMIMVAQTVVTTAEQPLDCSDISRAKP